MSDALAESPASGGRESAVSAPADITDALPRSGKPGVDAPARGMIDRAAPTMSGEFLYSFLITLQPPSNGSLPTSALPCARTMTGHLFTILEHPVVCKTFSKFLFLN
jgi:hypothetical protein